MKLSDLLINIVCTVLVTGMGIVALWSEYGGKDIEIDEDKKAEADSKEKD